MKKIILLLLLPLLATLFACDGNSEDEISSPEISEELTNPNNYPEEIFSDSELEKNIIPYTEKYRPQYHYSPKANWVNDPNGLVYYEGVWHLYYQYNPTSNTNNSNTHWGHATSTDLVNWEEQGIALFPDDLGTMWSGTGVVDHNNTSGFFTNTPDKKGIVVAYSTNTQHVGIAYSLDGGYTFKKVSTDTPVVEKPVGVNDFRDPHIFWYEPDQKWVMVVAGGYVRIFESKNLVDWTHCSDTGINTECPNLLRMNVVETREEKWLLSLGGRSYIIGSFDGKNFTKESGTLTMNYGPDSYAGITFSNAPDGRIIMLSWVNNWAYTQIPDGIWNGCFTIPVEFELHKIDNSYQLVQTPISEMDSNRGNKLLNIENKYFENSEDPLKGVKSNTFEMNLEIDLEISDDFELNFCVGDGDKTVLKFDKNSYQFIFKRSDSKHGIDALKNYLYSIPISKSSCINNILKIRIYVDVSNIEIFINDGLYYFSARIQPFSSSRGMALSYKNNIMIKNLEIFEMNSIFFDENEKIMSPHVSSDKDINLKTNEEYILDVYAFNKNCYAPIKVKSTNENVAIVELNKNQLKVKAVGSGESKIMIISGKYYIEINCTVYYESDSNLNSMLNNFKVTNGALLTAQDYYLFNCNGGDSFAISNELCKNFTYEADIAVLGNGAGALIFKATDNLSSFYCMNLDMPGGFLKLWKKVNGKVEVITTYNVNLEKNHYYNLKVVVNGNNIKVYFDGNQVIDIIDNSISEGYLGLNVWDTSAKFNNIIFSKN